jgi:hypothetical protein
MRSFFVICQICADAVDHRHNERPIIQIQPIRASNKLIGAISYERAVYVLAQIWLVKSCHDFF